MTVLGFIASLIFATTLAATGHANTSLAPGDVVDVQVFGEPTLSQQVTVARDGSITLPLAGRVVVRGLSTTDAAQQIATALKRYVRQPNVAVAIHTEAQYNVLVLGNVKQPGRYTVHPGSHLTDAIAAAGGLGPVNGKLPDARLSIGDAVRTISLEGVLRKGDVAGDVELSDGAAVYVPSPVTLHVRVLGAVDHPGEIEINEGDRLAVAVAKAGNSPSANGDLNRIRITRQTPSGAQTQQVNLYKMLQGGDLKDDVALQSDDVIFVPEAYKQNGNAAGTVLLLLRRLICPFC